MAYLSSTDASDEALALVTKALNICEQLKLEFAVMLLRDVVMVLEEGEDVEGWGRKSQRN